MSGATVEPEDSALSRVEFAFKKMLRQWEGSPRGDAFSVSLRIVQDARAAIASARIKGDKGRENPAERPHLTPPMLETKADVTNGITALQWIADVAYVDHKSGNENFEYLQSVARDAIRSHLEAEGGR